MTRSPLSLPAVVLLFVAACGRRATLEWRPSLVSQVPDSTPVRISVGPERTTTQGLAWDWQRGRPRVITARRDTVLVPDNAILRVRLRKKSGHAIEGLFIGWAVGVGVSYAQCPEPKRYCGEQDPTPVLGAGLGALVGSAIRTYHWVRVRRDQP